MTLSDYSITAFAFLNGARVIAYAPQIQCLARDTSNAASVSLMTWVLFALANIATVAYSLVVINDALMAAIFVLNFLGCLTIVVMIAKKRIGSPAGALGANVYDSLIATLLRRLMSAWRRSAEKHLQMHLMLTLPSNRVRFGEGYLSAIDDKYRHHPYIRE